MLDIIRDSRDASVEDETNELPSETGDLAIYF